jgi:hypothetical protein
MQALLTAAVLSVFGVAHTALIPSFAEEALGSREAFPLIFASTGVGATIGALATGVEGRPQLRRSTLRLFLYGLTLVGFAQSPNLAWALVAEAVVGFFYFSVMTSLQTLVQEVVDDAVRGRVMSLFFVAWGGLFPLGALLLGEIAKAIGVAPAVTGAGVVCALFGVNPATEEVLGQVADGTAADMERAVAAARRAFDTTDWATDHALPQAVPPPAAGRHRVRAGGAAPELVAEVGCPVLSTYGPQLDAPCARRCCGRPR